MTDLLTQEEMLHGSKVGKHILEKPMTLTMYNSFGYCQCPKYDKKVPYFSFLPDVISQWIGLYKPKYYNIHSNFLFEIPEGSMLVRPHVILNSKVYFGTPDALMRTNKAIFRGMTDNPSCFSEEELQECKCYPMAGYGYNGIMLKINSIIENKDESFDDVLKDHFKNITIQGDSIF